MLCVVRASGRGVGSGGGSSSSSSRSGAGPGLRCGCGRVLGRSLGALPSALFVGLSLLLGLCTLATGVHDHLWGTYVGALGLRDRDRTAGGARAAIGRT